MVAFDSYISSSIDSVLLDNREVARTATEHLLGHGYRNVVCVFGKPETYSFQERAAGYSEVMSAQSLIPRLLTAPSYELLGSVLQEVLQGKDRPEALLSLSDFASRSILTVYRDLGLKMAERIAEMVSNSLALLFSRLDGSAPKKTRAISLTGELILRRSCGCA